MGEQKQAIEKKTIGEELFLIHLRRNERKRSMVDEDSDAEEIDERLPRKRSRSIGEELFLVHLKRSEGCVENEEYANSNESQVSSEESIQRNDANSIPNIEKHSEHLNDSKCSPSPKESIDSDHNTVH